MLQGLPDAWDIQEIAVLVEDLAEILRGGLLTIVGCNGWDSLLEY